MGPIKNGYQLESYCPNVQFLAFFPCASHTLMRLYVEKADAWDAFLSVSFIFVIVPIHA